MTRVNNQSTQQQSSELSYSKVAGSSRSPAQPDVRKFLLLLKHRPLLVWSGVWAFLLAITAIAGFSLIYTGRVKQEEPQPTPITAQNPAETSSQTGSSMPIWLLSGVALTCAAGSLVISKRLKRSCEAQPLAPVPEETEPVACVLPPEESNPLDSRSESLAEMMDIRKQRPLSSILQESENKDQN